MEKKFIYLLKNKYYYRLIFNSGKFIINLVFNESKFKL